MKRAIWIAVGFFLFASIYLLNVFRPHVYAHPGRTDSQGGHYDRSTGEYHFHYGDSSPGKQPSSSDSTPRIYPGVTMEPKPTPRPTPESSGFFENAGIVFLTLSIVYGPPVLYAFVRTYGANLLRRKKERKKNLVKGWEHKEGHG